MKTLSLLLVLTLGAASVQADPISDSPEYPAFYCAQRRQVVHHYVIDYGTARNAFAAQKQFSDFTSGLYRTQPDIAGGASALSWIDEHAGSIGAALEEVRGEVVKVKALASDVADAAVEGCQRMMRLRREREVRALEALKAEQAETALRCPNIAQYMSTMNAEQLRRACPLRD